jgi:transcriptional regulator GlxA family with amidase domain
MHEREKIVAAVCRAPWLLIESGLAKGLKATSYESIKTDMVNAGAKWEDSEVVIHRAIITSRNPDDLEAFSAKIVAELAERRGNKRTAAWEPVAQSRTNQSTSLLLPLMRGWPAFRRLAASGRAPS